MKRSVRWICVAFTSMALVAIPAFAAAPGVIAARAAPDAAVRPADRVMMYAGEVRVLKVHNVKRVALGNGKLVSVQQVGDELILIAQAAGNTNMLLWHANGSVRAYNISVTSQDAREVGAGLASALASVPGLRVASDAGRVVLSGDVTPDDFKRVQTITQQIPGVVNLTHPSTVDMQRMVYLDVQVVDFKKSALQHIGINWQSAMAGPVLGIVKNWRSNPYYRIGDLTQGGADTNKLQGPQGPLTGLPLQMPYAEYFGITSSLSSMINLASQNGDAYVLANPQLSTRSGGTASFLAGGQIPIPMTSVLGQSTVQYKDYGVHLDIKPVADAHGNVLADINTEVSQIDPSVTIDGFPGFLTRKTSSVVNVQSGQTIVLSGLVQSAGSNALNKFPWLGDIPILGYLFRDKNFSASKSELVIFVTPEIITPHSAVNHELVQRGTQVIHDFDKEYGDGIQMAGFGIGPGSHPRAERAAAQATPAAASSVTRPASDSSVPAIPATTYPRDDGSGAVVQPAGSPQSSVPSPVPPKAMAAGADKTKPQADTAVQPVASPASRSGDGGATEGGSVSVAGAADAGGHGGRR
jgi:pilus assembly protein CpaC